MWNAPTTQHSQRKQLVLSRDGKRSPRWRRHDRYGQPILTGLHLDRIDLILEGALPAAMLAVMTQLLFELVERALVPKGLRLSTVLSVGSMLHDRGPRRSRREEVTSHERAGRVHPNEIQAELGSVGVD